MPRLQVLTPYCKRFALAGRSLPASGERLSELCLKLVLCQPNQLQSEWVFELTRFWPWSYHEAARFGDDSDEAGGSQVKNQGKTEHPITGTITLVIKGKTLTVPLTYNGTNDNGHWHYVTMPDIRKGKTTFVQTIRVPDTLVNPETAEKAKVQPEDKNGTAKVVNPADDARISRLEVAIENQGKALGDLIAALTPKAPKVVDQTAAASHAPVVEAKKQ